jgi:Uma2 family endonuclease
VEVFSPSTFRRDQTFKKDFYEEAHIPEYWMIDPERREVTVVRADSKTTVNDTFVWHPSGAGELLTIAVASIFGSR